MTRQRAAVSLNQTSLPSSRTQEYSNNGLTNYEGDIIDIDIIIDIIGRLPLTIQSGGPESQKQ